MNFNFGKKSKSIFQYAIIGIVFTSIVTGVSRCTKIPEEQLYDIVDEVQRKLPGKPLNDYIITDPVLLDRRVKRDVDRAIRVVAPEYDRIISDYDKKYKQKYVEEKNDETLCYTDECKTLAPPMRICSPWIDDCSKE
jgi:hypothetical protein